jgi:hypothetical protein
VKKEFEAEKINLFRSANFPINSNIILLWRLRLCQVLMKQDQEVKDRVTVGAWGPVVAVPREASVGGAVAPRGDFVLAEDSEGVPVGEGPGATALMESLLAPDMEFLRTQPIPWKLRLPI